MNDSPHSRHWLATGHGVFTTEMAQIHGVTHRLRNEWLRQRKIDYQTIVDDIFSISRGRLVLD